METTALNMSEFSSDMKEQMKIETSRTVKIVMLTYRCLLAFCTVAVAQFIFVIVTKLVEEQEIKNVMKLMSEKLETEHEIILP
jgi:hypothetical protein